MSFVLLLLIEFTTPSDNPDTNLITFILIPSIIVFGLFIVIGGVLFERRRRRHLTLDEIAAYPVLDRSTKHISFLR